MFLGIDDQTGLVYEGIGSTPDRPVFPVPMVCQARLMAASTDWACLPPSYRGAPLTWLFREDFFDAVTRTRRGRLYQFMEGVGYPDHNTRVMPHTFEDPGGRLSGADGRLHRPLHVYAACTSLFRQPNAGLGATLALGNKLAASAWRIVSAEITASDDVMLVLKSLSSFGIMPSLNLERIDERFREEIARAVQKVLDSAFRESSVAVVDACRDAVALIASRWLCQQSGDETVLRKDLAQVANALLAAEKRVAANTAHTLALLHVRGKSNEQLAKGLRPPSEDDAEFALHAVALMIRELGWARSAGYLL